jgi:hypothetical protein
MDNFDELIEFIESQIRFLDEKWFIKKKAEFKGHEFYDGTSDKIRIIVDSVSYNQEVFFDAEEEEYYVGDNTDEKIYVQDIHEFNLVQYCGAYLPIDELTDWGTFAFEDCNSNNFREVSFIIASKIQKYVSELKSNGIIEGIREIIKIRFHFQEKISEIIELLVKETENVEYKTTMNHFLISCIYELEDKIKIDKTLFNLTYPSDDKLEFNLQQEELAALLYILNRAQVFNTSNYNDTSILKFCARYFYFKKKGEYQAPTSEKAFSDKYRENMRDTAGKGLEKIIARLKATLQELT